MSFQERTRGGIRDRLFRLFLRLVGIIPEGGIRRLVRVPEVRKIYHWFVRFSPQEMLLEVQGNKMYITPVDSALSRELLIYGIYEKGEVRVFHQLIKKGMTVLDLGANIGYFTLIAAKLVGPEGKVFAFEPDPKNFSLLQRNVELNGYDNITLVQKAVADKSGTAEFYLGSDSWEHSLSSVNRKAGVIPVSVTSLDEFLPQDIAVDFIKMDIEGAEEKALRGMERILSKGTVKAIPTEFHFDELESQGSSFREIWDELSSLSFEFYEMRDDGISRVDFKKAFDLADKQIGGCNLLCMRT